ncbi:MAG: redox-sensing transcriptional repressor Rex [Treponemataceae bacterium]|nr:redox-sensing transcriptional repressor Rex [Spirochaetales bacterium]MDY6031754.1 redox-sensing transcriptional repressor Rex [Treponemataceae bacterium]
MTNESLVTDDANESKKKLPKPTQERLIKLLSVLDQLEKENQKLITPKTTVTSAIIEHRTGWSRDTVRRDISLLDLQCGSSVGYNIAELKKAIQQKFNIGERIHNCCIVGLGRLGSALLYFEGFKETSFVMRAGFDSNVNRTEVLDSPFPLYPLSKMESVVKNEKIDFAVLAVPEGDAVETAERLAKCGIKGIVNYTMAVLNLPPYIRVENISIVDALQRVSVHVE